MIGNDFLQSAAQGHFAAPHTHISAYNQVTALHAPTGPAAAVPFDQHRTPDHRRCAVAAGKKNIRQVPNCSVRVNRHPISISSKQDRLICALICRADPPLKKIPSPPSRNSRLLAGPALWRLSSTASRPIVRPRVARW